MSPRRPPAPRVGLTGFGHVGQLKTNFLDYVEGFWREYGDAFRLWIGGVNLNFFAHPDFTEAVLVSRAEDFGKPVRMRQAFRHLIRDGSPLNDGPEWPARRRLVSHALATLDYGQVAAATRRQTRRLILDRARDADLDLADALERIMICTAIESSLGEELAPDADPMFDEIMVGLNHTIEMTHSPVPPWFPTRRRRHARQVSRYLVSLAEAALGRSRQNGEPPTRCMIAAMDQLQRSSAADDREIAANFVTEEALMMILGGKETAGPAAMWTTYLLAAHPEFQAAVVDELRAVVGNRTPTAGDVPKLTLLGAAYSEAIRMYPPAFIVLRQARRRTTVGPYRVGRGDLVCIYTYGVHRNPRWFESPDTYNPYRFLGDNPPSQAVYTPFGLGRRACPAGKFATVATVLLLANVLREYKLEIPPESPPVKPHLFMGLRPKEGLRLRLVERKAKVGTPSPV